MKNYLSQYRLIGLRVQSRLERIAFFKDYPNTEEHCRHLYDEVKELKKTQERIAGLIDSLSEPYKSVLGLKYVEGYTLEAIAEKLNYTYRWTQALQRQAIEVLKTSAEKFILTNRG